MQQRHVLSKCKRHYFEVTLELKLRSVLLRQTTSVIFFGNSAVRSSTGRTKSGGESYWSRRGLCIQGFKLSPRAAL